MIWLVMLARVGFSLAIVIAGALLLIQIGRLNRVLARGREEDNVFHVVLLGGLFILLMAFVGAGLVVAWI